MHTHVSLGHSNCVPSSKVLEPWSPSPTPPTGPPLPTLPTVPERPHSTVAYPVLGLWHQPQESAKTSPSCGAFNPVLGAWHFVSANAQVVTIDAKTNAVLHSPTMPTGEFAFQVSALVVDPTIGTLYVVGVLIGSPPCQTFTMFRVDPATANLTEVGPVDIGSIEACVGTFVPPPPPSALSPGAVLSVTAVGGAVALVSRLAIQTFSVTDGRSLTNLTLPRSLGDVFQFAFNPVAREFVVAHERNDGSKAAAGVASLDAATGVVTDRFAFPHNLAGQPFMGQGPGLVAGGAFLVQVKNNTFPDQPPYVAPLYSLAMTPSGTHEWTATVVDSPFGIYDSFMGLGVLR
eukprot:m.191146 g.191146  ORF g.191146 m.191146 type:complete len:346 (+) comp24912_c0_seq1:451-1488(+)